jgi:hypothetical protein
MGTPSTTHEQVKFDENMLIDELLNEVISTQDFTVANSPVF